jgi:hypothetical protein
MKLPFRRHRNLFAAALLLLPTAVPKTHNPAPKTNPAPKAAPAPEGKLDIRLLVTDEPDRVLHPAKAADGTYPQAQPVTLAQRGRLLVGFIFFKDCKADARRGPTSGATKRRPMPASSSSALPTSRSRSSPPTSRAPTGSSPWRTTATTEPSPAPRRRSR